MRVIFRSTLWLLEHVYCLYLLLFYDKNNTLLVYRHLYLKFRRFFNTRTIKLLLWRYYTKMYWWKIYMIETRYISFFSENLAVLYLKQIHLSNVDSLCYIWHMNTHNKQYYNSHHRLAYRNFYTLISFSSFHTKT